VPETLGGVLPRYWGSSGGFRLSIVGRTELIRRPGRPVETVSPLAARGTVQGGPIVPNQLERLPYHTAHNLGIVRRAGW
jgi:hypothetical protein